MRHSYTKRRNSEQNSAVEALRRAVELTPGGAIAQSTLALALDQSGQVDEAVKTYRATIEIDPNNGVALNNLAYLIAKQGGHLDEALEYAQRAAQAMPRSLEVKDTLGWIYLKKGMANQALAIFREIVLANAHAESFRNHLLMALEQRGDSVLAGELKAAIQAQNWSEVEQLLKRTQ
jgi:Flp pilus assembly protein TadD